ncbi:MAG: putative transrane protein [Frankiales bacterium]|nr:putative transrane protein [Frankiales bacterium]
MLVLPSSDDPVVAAAVEAVGGPPGRHARIGDRRFWTPMRVLIALTLLTSLLGFAQKAPCRDGSTWVHEHQYTRACYSDVVALYSAEGLSSGQLPYYEHPVEYPVVIGGVMELSSLMTRAVTAALPSHGSEVNARGRHFYDITWLLVTICALVVTVTTARLAGRRVWDAALFALSPALLLHATTNWDLIAMALAGLGLLAWARRRPAAAGVLLGLATATKLYPVLFLLPLLFLCLRAAKLRAWGVAAAMTVLVAVGVSAPVYLTAPSFADVNGAQTKVLDAPLSRIGTDGLFKALAPHQRVNGVEATNAVYRFFELNQTRGADWDSLYLQAQHLRTDHGSLKGVRNAIAGFVTDGTSPPTKLNLLVAVLVLLVMAGIAVLTFIAPRRPRVPQLLFLTVTGFLLVNKVDSPQYVLWLVPLAVLAHPRWRPFLAWQAAEAVLLLSRFYFFVSNDKPGQGIDIGWFFAAVLLRDLLLVGFAAYVVRDILRPDDDVVRRDGVDDPAGGVLDGAPDRRAVALA